MQAHPSECLDKFDDSDDEDPQDPSYLPEMIAIRKRKRTDSTTTTVTEVTGVKKLRRSTSDLAKEFGCREEGCTKRFKTVGDGFFIFLEAQLADVGPAYP